MSVPPSPLQSGPSDGHEANSPSQSAETVYHLAREWLENDKEDDSDDNDMDYEPPSERSEDAGIFSGDSGETGDGPSDEQDVGGIIGIAVL